MYGRMCTYDFYIRDFLSVRHVEVEGDHFYSASKAVVSAIKPEQHGKVR